MRAAECNGCGQCCDPVVLPFTQREIMATLPSQHEHPADREHMLHDLIPISRREGLARAPYLSGGVTWASIDGGRSFLETRSVFYECRHFDRETRRCRIYERRPPMCRDYPWYGDPPDGSKALPPDCSYIEDVPEELRHPQMRERLRMWRRELP